MESKNEHRTIYLLFVKFDIASLFSIFVVRIEESVEGHESKRRKLWKNKEGGQVYRIQIFTITVM